MKVDLIDVLTESLCVEWKNKTRMEAYFDGLKNKLQFVPWMVIKDLAWVYRKSI